MKTVKKIFILFFVIICILMMLNFSNVEAGTIDSSKVDSIFKPGKENPGIAQAKTTVKSIINNFITVVKVIGLGVSIMMIALLGSKYMTGSIEEKAEIKKHAVVYVVGAILFFGAYGILTIIQDGIQQTFKV